MALVEVGMLRPGTQFLAPLTRNMGDAWLVIIKRLAPHNTVKWLCENFGYDRSTAKNAVKGVVGAVPITRAMHERQKRHGDAWELWDELGELIIGETREAFDARRLEQMAEELSRAERTLQTRRLTRIRLEASAAELSAMDLRADSKPGRGGRSGRGEYVDEAGAGPDRETRHPASVELVSFAPKGRGRT